MSQAFSASHRAPVDTCDEMPAGAVQPDPALLCAVVEQLAQLLNCNRHLSQNPRINFHARRRLEAIIASLIEAA